MNSNMLINIFAFGVLSLSWLAFGAAIVFNQAWLDSAWQAFRGLPMIVQVIVGLLFLPVVLGLWIWESDLPFVLRLVLVLGLGIATIYTFFPKQS